MMTSGIAIILIIGLGYISNWLNWRFLDNSISRVLYYIGAFVHESSHAIVALCTGSKVIEFSVFSKEPHVLHERSRIPLIGNALVAIAPVFGGLLFVFLINKFVLEGTLFTPSHLSLSNILYSSLAYIYSFSIFHWQSWVGLFLLLNIGAMIGPSIQDLKNMWILVFILLFVQIESMNFVIFSVIGLLAASIIIQICIISFIYILRIFIKRK